MRKSNLSRVVAIVLISTVLAAACGDDDDSDAASTAESTASSTSAPPATDEPVVIGFANAADTNEVLQGMNTLMQAHADSRGWELQLYNNELDGPTALTNADTMIANDIDYAVEFQVDVTVMPALAKKFADAGIPMITLDIPAPGAYFVGTDNTKSGRLAGEALGRHAEEAWNCEADLVLLMDDPSVGTVSNLRVDGVVEGLGEVCPDLVDGIVRRDVGTDGAATARDVLVANPDARRILFSGLNDGVANAAILAAQQLDRSTDAFGWGQDGTVLTSGDAPPELGGSVLYFLEGYPAYVFVLLDRLVSGEDVPVGDAPESPDAIRIGVCSVTAEEAGAIPPIDERLTLLEANLDQKADEIFCP